MRQRLARLFTIKTRTEALLVTYAIAVGAIERGLHYMEQYPGYSGLVLALACLGVPFIAGAKLVDSVKPQQAVAPKAQPAPTPARANYGRRRDDVRFGRKRVMSGVAGRNISSRRARR